MFSRYWAPIADRPNDDVISPSNGHLDVKCQIDDQFGGVFSGRVVYPKEPGENRMGVVIAPGWESSQRRTWWLADELAKRGAVALTFDYRWNGTEVAKDYLGTRMSEKMRQFMHTIVPTRPGSYFADMGIAMKMLDTVSSDHQLGLNCKRGAVGLSTGGWVAATFNDPNIVRRVAVAPYRYQHNGESLQPGTMFVQCTQDDVAVPAIHCEPMYAAAPEPKDKFTVVGPHKALEDGGEMFNRGSVPSREKLNTFAAEAAEWLLNGKRSSGTFVLD